VTRNESLTKSFGHQDLLQGTYCMKCPVAHNCNLLCGNRKLFVANPGYLRMSLEQRKQLKLESKITDWLFFAHVHVRENLYVGWALKAKVGMESHGSAELQSLRKGTGNDY
jgi:hypothetical protein